MRAPERMPWVRKRGPNGPLVPARTIPLSPGHGRDWAKAGGGRDGSLLDPSLLQVPLLERQCGWPVTSVSLVCTTHKSAPRTRQRVVGCLGVQRSQLGRLSTGALCALGSSPCLAPQCSLERTQTPSPSGRVVSTCTLQKGHTPRVNPAYILRRAQRIVTKASSAQFALVRQRALVLGVLVKRATAKTKRETLES